MKPMFNETTSASIGDLCITVVYDNNPYKKGLITSWGFACVIKGAEETILFDTGGDSVVLLTSVWFASGGLVIGIYLKFDFWCLEFS